MARAALIGLLAAVAVAGCGGGPAASPRVDAPATELRETGADVLRIIDGDTIEVAIAGSSERVRYIGMNTPEKGQRCEVEATAANEALVGGTRVRLVRDVENRDVYGRLLRYVYAGEVFVNLELARQGFAQSLRIPPNVAHADEFSAAVKGAREADAGCLWNAEAVAALRSAATGATPTPTPSLPIAVERFHYNASGDDAQNLNDEYVTLVNLGDDLDIVGWAVDDASGHTYRFPRYMWRTGARITLHSGEGPDGDGAFHWGSKVPVWNNTGDRFTLIDAEGKTVLVHQYGG